MGKDTSRLLERKIISTMLDNPCLSLSELARHMGKFKTSVYRAKKRLEENKTILGYTPVVNDIKRGHYVFIVIVKGKLDIKSAISGMISYSEEKFAKSMGIRLIDVFFTMGQYDFVIVFSAENEINGRGYIDSIEERYADFIEERPVVLTSFLILRKEGKVNSDPEVLNRLPSRAMGRSFELLPMVGPGVVRGICICCTYFCANICEMHLFN